MAEFRFKRFIVRNERSAMKVNTDGVLLGAFMTLSPEDSNILDIGTGTGTIALMAAQRLSDLRDAAGKGKNRPELRITGIDIDKDSADEAAANFKNSPWTSNLQSINISLADFAFPSTPDGNRADYRPDIPFDAIVSNPPYFESSLKAPDERRCKARHSDSLSYREIFRTAEICLKDSGRLSLILPADQETAVIREGAASGLYLFRTIRIRTVPHKKPSRIIMEFSRHKETTVQETLTIQEKGTYTEQYKSLVNDFLLI